MADNTRASFLQVCRAILAGVDQNAGELGHVQGDRAALGDLVVKIDEGIVRQNLHLSQYQGATEEVENAVKEARELLVRIKNAVRAKYGLRSQQLQKFGIAARTFLRKAGVSKNKPAEAGPTHLQPATPETDGTIQK